MSHRRLTEGCLFALRALAESNAPTDIYNRVVATNLRVVERVFPELIRIVPAAPCDHIGARPVFGAILTARGRDFIIPRKLRKAGEVRA